MPRIIMRPRLSLTLDVSRQCVSVSRSPADLALPVLSMLLPSFRSSLLHVSMLKGKWREKAFHVSRGREVEDALIRKHF